MIAERGGRPSGAARAGADEPNRRTARSGEMFGSVDGDGRHRLSLQASCGEPGNAWETSERAGFVADVEDFSECARAAGTARPEPNNAHNVGYVNPMSPDCHCLWKSSRLRRPKPYGLTSSAPGRRRRRLVGHCGRTDTQLSLLEEEPQSCTTRHVHAAM